MKSGNERPILKVPALAASTSAVEVGYGVDWNGNPVTTAGAPIAGVAGDDHDAADIALNTTMLTKKKVPIVVLGTARFMLGATVAAGKKLAIKGSGSARFIEAVAGQTVCGITLEGGVDGDLVEGYVVAQTRRVASAAIPDTAGAVVAALETEVNAIKAALRAQGIILP